MDSCGWQEDQFFKHAKKRRVENCRRDSLTLAQVGSSFDLFNPISDEFGNTTFPQDVPQFLFRQEIVLMMLQSSYTVRMMLFFPIVHRSFIHPNHSWFARLMHHQQDPSLSSSC